MRRERCQGPPPHHEQIAQKLAEVTRSGKQIFTQEMFCFLTKRKLPRGYEFQYSHKLKLPPERLAALQVLNEDELKQQLAAGGFGSATTCDDDFVADFNLDNTFQNKSA